MDTIFIRQLRLQAWIGLYRHEKIAPQTIEIDLEIALPGDAVFKTQKVADTIDYGVVVEHVRALLAKLVPLGLIAGAEGSSIAPLKRIALAPQQ